MWTLLKRRQAFRGISSSAVHASVWRCTATGEQSPSVWEAVHVMGVVACGDWLLTAPVQRTHMLLECPPLEHLSHLQRTTKQSWMQRTRGADAHASQRNVALQLTKTIAAL